MASKTDPQRVLASMGPRSGDRGNAQDRAQLRADTQLQWGRDLEIAEIAWLEIFYYQRPPPPFASGVGNRERRFRASPGADKGIHSLSAACNSRASSGFCASTRLSQASPRHKRRVVLQLATQHLSQQARLDLQHPAVGNAVVK